MQGYSKIRRADQEDVAALVEISRSCFPDYLEWCTKSQARRWWTAIVRSESCETWLYEKEGMTAGFIRLVKNPVEHQIETKQLRPGMLMLGFSLLVRPKHLLEKLAKKLIKEKIGGSPQTARSLGKRPLWMHSLAVSPRWQNMGIGREIYRFSEKRASELGFDSIAAFVNKKNKGSIAFHEKLGFTRTNATIRDHFSVVRVLDVSPKLEKCSK